MKLELKYIKNYPPTLRFMWEGIECTMEGIDYVKNGVILERVSVPLTEVKPILYPILNLQDAKYNMASWRKGAIEFLDRTANLPYNSRREHIGGIMHSDLEKIFEWELDIYGWISQGLAINRNTL